MHSILGASDKKYKYLLWARRAVWTVFLLCIAGYAAWLAIRVWWADQFVVPSGSMSPTLIKGDRILVNKRIFGPRIYDKFDFSDGAPLVAHRLKGKRPVKHNDILVFNFPLNATGDSVKFKINYVYVKRCIGLPGDTVSAENGYYRNNHYAGMLGLLAPQRELSYMDTAYFNRFLNRPEKMLEKEWTLKDFGPYFVPAAGSIVELNDRHHALYGKYIEYETGLSLVREPDGKFFLGGEKIISYTFRNNYYFMCGDNVTGSYDSRNWGPVPEDFIIGVVTTVSYSRGPDGKLRKDRRWLDVTGGNR